MKSIHTTANPLEVLGVPRSLIVREYDQGTLERVQLIAESNYKALSKLYHPDRSGGDANVMAALTQAYHDLRHPEDLEYFVAELLDTEDFEKLDRLNVRAEVEASQRRAYQATLSVLPYVHQFEMMKVFSPTSFVVEFNGDRLIIDVVSSHRTTMYIAGSSKAEQLSGLHLRRENGIWSDNLAGGDEGRIYYTNNRLLGSVRVIGGVPLRHATQLSSGPILSSSLQLDAASEQSIQWLSPAASWFMGNLRPWQDDDYLVIMKGDHVALTGGVIASAPIS